MEKFRINHKLFNIRYLLVYRWLLIDALKLKFQTQMNIERERDTAMLFFFKSNEVSCKLQITIFVYFLLQSIKWYTIDTSSRMTVRTCILNPQY